MAEYSYRRVSWLDSNSISNLPTAQYWNDESAEKGKVFDISSGDFDRLKNAIDRKGILPQVEKFCNDLPDGGLKGRGISLGAGICWLESEILKRYPSVTEVICVEFSRHRIFELAPKLLAHEKIDPSRVTLCLGSFYELKVDDQSLDFVILCQAFHHAAEPNELLAELHRVVRPGGIILVVGEHYFGFKKKLIRYLKHLVKWIINYKGYRAWSFLLPKYKHLFPGDPVKGDIHYSMSEYAEMFDAFGFKWIHIKDAASGQQGFSLRRC
jgi:ubiquinone/menaquinone biosynthesis C-methylase UbiE